MRHLILAVAISLAFVTATASAHAQVVIYNTNTPVAPGVYVVNSPPFYNGLSYSNGIITAFPAATRYGYPSPSYPVPPSYYGFPANPSPYPFSAGYGSPGVRRP